MKQNTLPVRITASALAPVMGILSVLVLYRGHHLPGGGFIGGLMAASGVTLVLLGHGPAAARKILRVQPVSLIVSGLAVATGAGFVAPVLKGLPFMSAVWLPAFTLPLLGAVHLGTPLLFDIGVYFAVIGFVLVCLFALVKADETSSHQVEG